MVYEVPKGRDDWNNRRERAREMIRGVCKENEVEIIKGHISNDHVHLPRSVPLHLLISKLVRYLKGKSSYKVLQEYGELSKIFCGRHLWSQGYFVAMS